MTLFLGGLLVACAGQTPVEGDASTPESIASATAVVAEVTSQDMLGESQTLSAPTPVPPIVGESEIEATPLPAASPTPLEAGAEETADSSTMPATNQPPTPVESLAGSQLPVFVEMVQAPLLSASPERMPPEDFNPSGVYTYDAANRLLLIQPAVEVLPTTEVLVGLASAQVPNRPYLPSALFQIPSAQAPLRAVAIEPDGTLTLSYADQTFELRPGESRSFKQQTPGELAAIEMTTITNYGRLAGTGTLPADPGSP
jgi:hypothetical protein